MFLILIHHKTIIFLQYL